MKIALLLLSKAHWTNIQEQFTFSQWKKFEPRKWNSGKKREEEEATKSKPNKPAQRKMNSLMRFFHVGKQFANFPSSIAFCEPQSPFMCKHKQHHQSARASWENFHCNCTMITARQAIHLLICWMLLFFTLAACTHGTVDAMCLNIEKWELIDFHLNSECRFLRPCERESETELEAAYNHVIAESIRRVLRLPLPADGVNIYLLLLLFVARRAEQ